jgi:hypothetical protein
MITSDDFEKILAIPGYMSYDKLLALSNIVSNKKNVKTVVEVGSYCGRSSVCMAMSLDSTVNINCIDHFYTNRAAGGIYADGKDGRPLSGESMNQFDEFKKHTSNYKNIKMISGYCPYDVTWSGEDIDIFFLDSDHKNPDDFDILSYFCSFMKTGGIIIGDDHLEDYIHGRNVIENVKILENAYGVNAQFFGDRKDLWLIEVTKDNICLKEYV